MITILTPSSGLEKVVARVGEDEPFTRKEAARAFEILLKAAPDEDLYDAFFRNLDARELTPELVCGAADAMRAAMRPLRTNLDPIDVCGTGGDGRDTVNISTAVAFVVAACGVPVAKHGNSAISSRSGSLDVLQALGVNLNVAPVRLSACLDHAKLCFIPAPLHHPALKSLKPARRRFGKRTIFNILGPLCNPAGATRQLIGVGDPNLVDLMGLSAKALGYRRAYVVHGVDGVDEVSLSDRTRVFRVEGTESSEFSIWPEDANVERAPLEALKGGDAQENAEALLAVLSGATGAYRDAVLLNAAVALVVSGEAGDVATGARLAAAAIDKGKAKETLQDIIDLTNADIG